MKAPKDEAELREMGDLTDLAERVHRYKFNLSYTYAFFTFGSIFAGGLLVLMGIGAITNPVILVTSLIAMAGAGVVVLHTVFAHTLKDVAGPKLEGLYWSLSFLVPFVTLYTLWFALGLPMVFVTSGGIWYLALGLALVSVAVSVENWYVASGLLVTRPFLVAGTIIVPTTPLLLLADFLAFTYAGNILGIGLMLLTYYAAASLLLVKAEASFRRSST